MWLSHYQEACIALARPWVPVQHLKIFIREEHLNETDTENRLWGSGVQLCGLEHTWQVQASGFPSSKIKFV